VRGAGGAWSICKEEDLGFLFGYRLRARRVGEEGGRGGEEKQYF